MIHGIHGYPWPHGAEGSSTPGARRLADAGLFKGQPRLQPMQILESTHRLLRFAVGIPDVIHLAGGGVWRMPELGHSLEVVVKKTNQTDLLRLRIG